MIKTKSASLFIATAVLLSLTAGCKKETAPEVEEIDLTQVPDIFEQPLQPNPLAPQPGDVAITVDGAEITYGEISQAAQMQMQQLSRQVPPQQLMQMQQQIVQSAQESLIANVLLRNAAENSSLAIGDEEVNEQIETIKANVPEGQSLEDALAANGIDFDKWKEDLRTQILVTKLVEEKTADVVEATDEDIAAFYNENPDSFEVPETYTASHILLMTRDLSDEEKAGKKTQLEKIKADIAAGAITFADAAKQHSEDPGSAPNGGEYKNVPKGQMVPEFEEAALSMELNALSDIVETEYGYHLIKATERTAAGTRSLEEVSEQLKAYLSGQKKQEAMVAYIKSLREKADIVMQQPDMDAGSAAPAE